MKKKIRPGDLITFPGLIGRDRNTCLVLAVVPLKNGIKVLYLTGLRIKEAHINWGGILSEGIEVVSDGC